jgi:aryl-alcohol dehydrogenase-like predicted oxidoreductase
MQYRRLGNAGVKVSLVGLGCNNFGRAVADVQQSARVVHRALDLGVNFIDTADVYGQGLSEEHLGAALQGRRAAVVLATKVGMTMGSGPNERGSSRHHIMAGVEASLRRLKMDYIDLYQIHRWDAETPVEETMRALDDLVHQGKVRYIGCSNYTAWQLVWSLWTSDRRGWTPFVSVQPEYSLLYRGTETELLPACQAFGIGVIPFFPLAGGLLTGKYREGEPAPAGTRGANAERFSRFTTSRNFAIVRRLETWARERGHTLTELAIAWLAARPMVATVITGATKPEQVEANVKAVEWSLTPAEVEEVATLAPVERAA